MVETIFWKRIHLHCGRELMGVLIRREHPLTSTPIGGLVKVNSAQRRAEGCTVVCNRSLKLQENWAGAPRQPQHTPPAGAEQGAGVEE